MAIDRLKQPVHEIFSAVLNADFNSTSPYSLRSTKLRTQVSNTDSAIVLSSMKMVADRHKHAFYHNTHWWRAF